MPVIFIDGEAGTTGLGIRERLAALPEVTLRSVDPARRKDAAARAEAMAACDLAVLCLPDEAARESASLAASLGERAPKLLDASTAHRTNPDWIYGFPELIPGQARAIADARRVSNPGCYATGAIALLRPLIEADILDAHHPVAINAVSGYSGGGKSMIQAHERDGGPAFELYALGLGHKHVPEIRTHALLSRRPLFVPSVGHFPRGMLVSIPLFLEEIRATAALLRDALATHYQRSRYVTVLPAEGERLVAESIAGSDAMELRVYADEAQGQAVLVARLDNLGKGASGAAVQNIRLMLGLLDG